MQAAKKIESLCLSHDEQFIFAGDLIGRLSVLEPGSFAVRHRLFAHAGTISAVAAHPKLPYVATLGADLSLGLWRYDAEGSLCQLAHLSLRAFSPDGEDAGFNDVYSQSQPLAFHSSGLKILTRTGNAGLIELQFDETGQFTVNYCVRVHREYDLITVAYAGSSDKVLSGSGDGEVCLSEGGVVLHRWQIHDTSIHWFEPVTESVYLVAADSRVIARINVDDPDDFLIGEPFSRDDLEHVCYDPQSGYAYTSGFDWNVYKIDIATCNALEVVYRAPFKCRWMFFAQRLRCLIIQCRNGSIIRFNVATGQVEQTWKETPDALWTAVANKDGEVLIAGEGDYVVRLKERGHCAYSLKREYDRDIIRHPIDAGAYTKRMAYRAKDHIYVLGRASGELVLCREDGATLLHRFPVPVRDIVIDAEEDYCYAATEDCRVHKVDFSGKHIAGFKTDTNIPIWSIAYNPEIGRIASFERYGRISILDAADLSLVKSFEGSGRCKRAKWLDNDKIVFSFGSELHLYSLAENRTTMLLDFVGNTIEDFIWDPGMNYFITICYTKHITLYDFESLKMLDKVGDGMDYSKGLLMLPQKDPEAYPLDFITYGRGGTANQYRIYNESIISLGPVFHIQPN